MYEQVTHFGFHVFGVIGLFLVIKLATNFRLWSIPGPSLAPLSSLYRVYILWSGNSAQKFLDLHKRYGPVVRTGPSHVLISDPSAKSIIYDSRRRFAKSDFYRVFAITCDGRTQDTVFSTRDNAYHRLVHSHTSGRFSISMRKAAQEAIENCTTKFIQRMRDIESSPVDFAKWIKFWSFDTKCYMNFGEDFGFLAEGRDINSIIAINDQGFRAGALIGQTPWVNRLLLENKVLMRLLACTLGVEDPTATFVEAMREKMHSVERENPSKSSCLLTYLREEQQNSKKIGLDDTAVLVHLANDLIAGSVTTASTIGAVLYFALKHPSVYHKLASEARNIVDVHERHDSLYLGAEKLPYTHAVITETLRLLPAINLPLERIVPPEGLSINGFSLPGGTNISMSAHTVHRNTDIFGTNADEFCPERWIDAPVAKVKEMNTHFFAFGHGHRRCEGRVLAMAMMSSFIIRLLQAFDIEWAGERDSWELKAWWTPEQHGFFVKFLPVAEK